MLFRRIGSRFGAMVAAMLFCVSLGGAPAYAIESSVGTDVGSENLPTCYVHPFVDRVDRRNEVYGSGASTCEATMQGALSMTLKRDGTSVGSDVCAFNGKQECTVGLTVRNLEGKQRYRVCVSVQGSIKIGNQPVIPIAKSSCYQHYY